MTTLSGGETTISMADARADLASTIDAAQSGPVRLTRRGRTSAAMISEAAHERLLEDTEDAQDDLREEAGRPTCTA